MFTCGATRLGAISHPLSAYNHMPKLLTELHLRLSYSGSPFLIALRSPFGQYTFTPITPSGALSEKEVMTYLLFINGLCEFNTVKNILSRMFLLLLFFDGFLSFRGKKMYTLI